MRCCWSCPGRGGGRGAGVVSGYGAGGTPKVIPKGEDSPEPVCAFQPNLSCMHSLSQGWLVIPSGDGSTAPFLSPWSLLQLLLLQDDLPAMPCTQAGGCIETDTELKQLWLPGPLPHSPASQPAPTSKAQFKAAFPQYRQAEQHLGCLLQPLRGSTRWGTWVFSQ